MKKILSILGAVSLLISNVNASTNLKSFSNNANDLFEEYLSLNDKLILAKELDDEVEIEKLTNQISSLDSKLNDVGTTNMPKSEVNELFDGVAPCFDLPDNDDYDYVTWKKSIYTYTMNGTKYSVKLVNAIANDTASILVTSRDNAELQSAQDKTISKAKEILQFYIKAGVSTYFSKLSSAYSFIPFDVFFDDEEKITNNSLKVTYICSSYLQFAFIKPYGSSDDEEMLAFVSNDAHLSYSVSLRGIADDKPYIYSSDNNNINYSSSYFNNAKAVLNNYLSNNSKTTDFVSGFMIYNSDKTKSLRINVSNPIGPGQIY